MAALPRLPACRQCYQRKVKCDSRRPKCVSCDKTGSECVFADPATGQVISREELDGLERRVRQLRGVSQEPAVVDEGSGESQTQSLEPEEDAASTVPQGSGLNFMSPLFNDQEWRQRNSYVLRSLANASVTAELNNESNELPPADEAGSIFDGYLRSPHIHNPFLLRQDVLDLHQRVFASQGEQPRNHDLFRTFMILALGSIHPYREGHHSHPPFGYYISAMRYVNPFILRDRLESIQDLFLLIRFGIYHHIGTSVWMLVRLCIRLCVEQGLHRREASNSKDLLQEQLRRRVFWTCYAMDRYSSITLNRPFALCDSDIDIGPAADAEDEQLLSDQTSPDLDSFIIHHKSTIPTEMSSHLFSVRLRQISSRIHQYFAEFLNSKPSTPTDQNSSYLETGRIHVALEMFTSELEAWRSTAPVFEAPRCTFERSEWYDLLQARETFHLVRRALDVAPKRDGIPSQSLLVLCQSSAVKVIQLYSDMFQKSTATYTRSYFQMMFTAGLSLLYCGSVLADLSLAEECSRMLVLCKTTLTDMTINLPDARHYVAVFDALHRHISLKLHRILQTPANPLGPTDFAPRAARTEDQSTELQQNNVSLAGLYDTNNAIEPHPTGYQPVTSSDGQYNLDNNGNPMYAMAAPEVGEGFVNFPFEGQSFADSTGWNWDLLNDEALWNVGQYVVGDCGVDYDFYNAI